jgi:hypothetical protein
MINTKEENKASGGREGERGRRRRIWLKRGLSGED